MEVRSISYRKLVNNVRLTLELHREGRIEVLRVESPISPDPRNAGRTFANLLQDLASLVRALR